MSVRWGWGSGSGTRQMCWGRGGGWGVGWWVCGGGRACLGGRVGMEGWGLGDEGRGGIEECSDGFQLVQTTNASRALQPLD